MLPIRQWLPHHRHALWAGIPLACALALGAYWTNRTGGEAPPSAQISAAGSLPSAQNPFPPIPTPPPPLPSPTGTPGVPPWWPRPSGQNEEDSPYGALLSGFLQGLAAQGGVLSQQGILLWTPTGELLAEHLLDQPLPVGALDQLAISLMALETWGYQHRFQTWFLSTGRLVGGRLLGDLIVVGSGDPYFREADVQALARHFHSYGIRQIDGNVQVLPSFRLLGQPDPLASGRRLLTLLQSGDPPIGVTGTVAVEQQVPPGACVLATHTSMELGSLLQILNGSNDRGMAEALVMALGGKTALLEYLHTRVLVHPLPARDPALIPTAEEVRLEQGTQELLLSPRALAHLWAYLLEVTEGDPSRLLPVAGVGHNPLGVRSLPPGTAAQVGSAGVFAAGRVKGHRLMMLGQLPNGINFVLLNHGLDPGSLRQQQDHFLRQLLTVYPSSSRDIFPQEGHPNEDGDRRGD